MEGKSVLDLGCASGYRRADWLHGLIRGVANDAVGVDMNERAVSELQERGYHIIAGNAEEVRLNHKFDVVFAGEIIEHLENFRAFLEVVHAHLHPTGVFVVTTPNAFRITNFVYRLWGKPRVNRQHTCWFCEDTLVQLLDRNGFQVLEVKYLRHETPGRLRPILARFARGLLPERLAWNTLCVVARPLTIGDA